MSCRWAERGARPFYISMWTCLIHKAVNASDTVRGFVQSCLYKTPGGGGQSFEAARLTLGKGGNSLVMEPAVLTALMKDAG